MYLQKPDHTKRIIQNLYTVWLPPRPQHNLIEGSDLKRSDQFWRRKPIPAFYDERRGKEEEIQAREQEMVDDGFMDKIKHFDPVLEEYRRREWYRRIMGHWFMNDGEAVYLTGAHYYYLQWCQFDHTDNNGYPLFYESQLDRFYFRQLCWEDPFCLGYIEIGPRGYGKTSEVVAMQLENITKPPVKNHAAIQSKTENDAQQVVFKEKMVPCYNALPHFFKPTYNHGSDPENMFVFRRDAKRGEGAKRVKYGDHLELNNTVSIYPAKEKALDGPSRKDIINDEVGKTDPKKEADVHKRTAVNVRVVFRNNTKRGLLRETSTVEEMDKGGDQCYEVWKESDPRIRDGNGYTVSKLYRYFVSALETQTDLADKHGRIDKNKAYEKVMNERTPIKDSADKLSLVMRKNPITVEEAFIKDQSKCIFNVFIITDRIQELDQIKSSNRERVGHFQWVNGEVDGDVEFIDDPLTGKATIWKMPETNRGDRKIMNACTYIWGEVNGKATKLWQPCNDDLYTSGTDPIKYVKTDDPRASLMAAHGFQKFDFSFDDKDKDVATWQSHNLMWKYHGRSEDPEDDYEQVIMAMRFYGHSIMPESNITDFNKHLQSRGYIKFRIVRQDFDDSIVKQKKGSTAREAIGSVPEVQNTYIREIKQYIQRHGKRCPDLELLKQCKDFDPANPTKFDLVISLGYTLISIKKRLQEQESQKDVDMIKKIFPTYNIRGNRSQQIVETDESGHDIPTIYEALGLPPEILNR